MIAILLCTYNGKAYIKEQLDSLATQTMRDFVCYIHDDGSTDGTMDAVKEWIEDEPASNKEGERRTRFVVLPGAPIGNAKDHFFWMLGQVEADYYMFCDQDDVWLPEKIAVSFNKIKELEQGVNKKDAPERPGLPLCVFSDMYVTDENLQVTAPSFIRHIGQDPTDVRPERLIIDNMAAGCTMLFNKAARDHAIRPVDTGLIDMHDRYIVLLCAIFGRLFCIDQPLSYYRQHAKNERGAATQTDGQRVSRNAREIVKGSFLAGKRAFRQISMDLAQALLSSQEEIPEHTRALLTKLSHADQLTKWERVRFFYKNGLNRAHHNLWFLLWV